MRIFLNIITVVSTLYSLLVGTYIIIFKHVIPQFNLIFLLFRKVLLGKYYHYQLNHHSATHSVESQIRHLKKYVYR
ncbi:hypothetical protein RIR_jg39504.t1 [Rhizophagus irregularis DAOM 181602=DAOM 197198]|nr:hypothetical protein RhiirB3_229940 [Rhizophagus irregularis]GET58321.1 hypothetical protein RIR_jg39504.t1 [Rhizophagus irregularis DAOM 181602=DAOM 197198]